MNDNAIKEMMDNIKFTQPSFNHVARDSTPISVAQFPPASLTAILNPKEIGIIVDSQNDVNKLVRAGKIDPPNNLRWIWVKSYEEFKKCIDRVGVPSYISFGSTDDQVHKDRLACPQLLIEVCKKQNLKELPKWECHCTTLTKKQEIEQLLIDYF